MKITRRTLLVISGCALVTGIGAEVLLTRKPNKPALPQSSGNDLSTPQNTLDVFIKAAAQWDTQVLAQCVVHGEPFTMPEMPQGSKGPTLTYTDLICTQEGNAATIAAKVHLLSEGNLPPQTKLVIWPVGYIEGSPIPETLRLTRVDNEWKIMASREVNPGYLNYCVAMSRYCAQAQAKARENSCLSNMKQIGQACRMALYDTKDQFKAETYEEWVVPYMKNEAIFHCPESDQPAVRSYCFNRNLIGLYVNQIYDPSRAVMLYEGTSDALQFRHQGKAGVVFVDGSYRMVTEAETKRLIWTF